MFIVRILNFIHGFLTIAVTGRFPERFINICIKRNIHIRDVYRYPGCIEAKIDIKDFKRIRPIVRKTGVRVKIKRRSGLPFYISRYKKRVPALIGVAALVFILYFTSTHITGIDITGNSRISAADIRSELSSIGVGIGDKIEGLDRDTIRNWMMNRFPDMAWFGITMRGSRAYVEITERLESPERLDPSAICNLVASRDGVIEKTEIKEGQRVVKTGDAVRKGDLLASGVISNANSTRLVHAYGEVYAATTYSLTRNYNLIYTDKEPTGDTKERYSVSFTNSDTDETYGRLDLFPEKIVNKPVYENYDVSEETWVVDMPVFIPDLTIIKSTFSEYEPVEKQRSISDAIEFGIEELSAEIEAGLGDGVEIKNKTCDHNILTGDTVSVTVVYECSENIAEEQAIDYDEPDPGESQSAVSPSPSPSPTNEPESD